MVTGRELVYYLLPICQRQHVPLWFGVGLLVVGTHQVELGLALGHVQSIRKSLSIRGNLPAN